MLALIPVLSPSAKVASTAPEVKPAPPLATSAPASIANVSPSRFTVPALAMVRATAPTVAQPPGILSFTASSIETPASLTV